ncbi:MAG: M12 family metallo-peptidase [Phycisphaerales bacterium]
MSTQKIDPGPVRTRVGTAAGDPETFVHGVWTDDGFVGTAHLKNGATLSIEPLSKSNANAPRNAIVIYEEPEDIDDIGTMLNCSVEFGGHRMHMPREFEQHANAQQPPAATSCEGGPYTTTLLCDSDFEFFDIIAGGDISTAQALIEDAIVYASGRFKEGPGFSILVDEIIIRTSPVTDPYTTSTAEGYLADARLTHIDSFDSRGISSVMVYSGIDLDRANGDPILGIAIVGGAGRASSGYALVDGQNTSIARRGVVTAHELGHNWGAPHCTNNTGCSRCTRTGSIMYPGPAIASLARFEDCSIASMQQAFTRGVEDGFVTDPLSESITFIDGLIGSGAVIDPERGVTISGIATEPSDELLLSVDSDCPSRPNLILSFGSLPISSIIGDLHAPGNAYSVKAQSDLVGVFAGSLEAAIDSSPIPATARIPAELTLTEGTLLPGGFDPLEPDNGAVFIARAEGGPAAEPRTRAAFRWSIAPAARSYTLIVTEESQLRAAPGEECLACPMGTVYVFEIDASFPASTSLVVGSSGDAQLGVGEYSWSMLANNLNGQSTISETRSFSVVIGEPGGGGFGVASTQGDEGAAAPARLVGRYDRTDLNYDTRTDVSDLMLLLDVIGGEAPDGLRADLNSDGLVTFDDLMILAVNIGI